MSPAAGERNCTRCGAAFWDDGNTFCPSCDAAATALMQGKGGVLADAAARVRAMRAAAQAEVRARFIRYPVINGHIVELFVPAHLEAHAREVMKEAPEVKITVREDLVGDTWIARTQDGTETKGEGGPIFEKDDAP